MNDGFDNEYTMINYIDGKKLTDYNENIKNFLIFLFGNDINCSLSFSAEKINGQYKPDLYIKHNNRIKYISLKKGSGNSVHQEKISVFFPFIEQLLGNSQLNNLKKFHYGDDTINDSGLQRYNATQCKIRYMEEIQELNLEINKWDNLIIFLDRFLFVGNIGETPINAIYYGTIDTGTWASKEEITNYIRQNNFNNNALHFGPLSYQVWGRNEKRIAVHPDRRYVMQIKWGTIANDLKNIRERNYNVSRNL